MSQKHLIGFFVGLIIGSVSLAYATWTSPTAVPPNENVAAPINVSNLPQDKQGVLTLGGLGVFGGTLITSSAGYTLPKTLQLGVNGKVGATAYCDQNGNNCVTTLGGTVASNTTSSGGQAIVCGGWDVKYGTSSPINAWGCATDATCPSGYDTIKSSKVTINLAEQTNLCVLHSAGGGGSSSSQIISGWPNTIACNKSGSTWELVSLSGVEGNNVDYSDKQDGGFWVQFNKTTKKYVKSGLGSYAPGAAACVGKDLTDPIWTWY